MSISAESLYEEDFYAWTQQQAELLRRAPRVGNELDLENIAEEIETLGRGERDAVRSQIRRIIEHLLKLAYSRAEPPRADWMETVLDARQTLSDKISPTLRRDAEENLGRLYADGRKRAGTALRRYGEPQAADALPHSCPYSLDDICREDWYPDRPGGQP